MSIRTYVANRFRFLGDRIDPDTAFRGTNFHMTMEGKNGFQLNEQKRGFKVWYQGRAEMERAFTECGLMDEQNLIVQDRISKRSGPLQPDEKFVSPDVIEEGDPYRAYPFRRTIRVSRPLGRGVAFRFLNADAE